MKNHYPKRTIISGVKLLTLFIGLLLANLYAHAQAPDFAWIRQSQGNISTASASGSEIVQDAQRNSYITGTFQGSVNFGNTTLNTGSGKFSVYVAKYDADGDVLWAIQSNSTGTSSANPRGIALDGSGNIYITGRITGSVTFGNTTLTESGSSKSGGDVFVAKIDSNGNVLWAKKAGGKDPDIGVGIAVDGFNKIYITGWFTGSATFGSTTLTSTRGIQNSSSADVFLAKYDANGNVLWAKKAGGTGADLPVGIAVDGSGNSYITGDFQGNATFGSTMLTNSTGTDVFLAKYDIGGNFQWAKNASGTGAVNARDITIDGSGNSYITGRISGIYGSGNVSATFGTITLTPSSGNAGGFLVKYDVDGAVIWAQNAGNGSGIGIDVDGNGNSYVAGCFCCSTTFGTTTLTNSGGQDIFVAKYGPSGNVLWAKKAGGTGEDLASGIAVDGSGNSYVTGYFQGSATFGSTTITSTGSQDAFIAKINAAIPSARYALPSAGTGSDGKMLPVHDMNAYPNPFTDKLMMELTSNTAAETAKVTLNSIDGKTVYQKEVKLTNGWVSEELDGLSRLPAGMYFLTLHLDEKPVMLKVLKQ